jgi:hypothetical protein
MLNIPQTRAVAREEVVSIGVVTTSDRVKEAGKIGI